jgi:hypothetical protein
MMIARAVLRMSIVAMAAMFAALAIAQSCNTLTGGVNCAGRGGPIDYSSSPSQGIADSGSSAQYRSFRSLGSELSMGGETPATIGAITFGGNGRQCSGLFRTTRC